jgi:hypothetical protein
LFITFPFLWICCAGGDDAHDLHSIFVFIESMANQQHAQAAYQTERLQAVFTVLETILFRERVWVKERLGGGCEVQTMLLHVQSLFAFVPSELNHTSMLLQHLEGRNVQGAC